MKQILSTLLLLAVCFAHAVGQNKALLVGISDYPSKWGFSKIHGAEDVEMIAKTLDNQGFAVTKITDFDATAANIRKALDSFITTLKSGDYVYIHFSCHGQPVEDLPPFDEDDSWDEAIIPYDAQIRYQSGIYEGENHIIDDELCGFFSKIRAKIGEKGFLCVAIDACHSGNSSRDDDDDELFVRGTKIGFSAEGKIFSPKINSSSNFKIDRKTGFSDILILEACRSYQNNYEVKIGGKFYGPLSYFIN